MISRTAQIAPCPRCQATILAGLDNDLTAHYVRADPTPISPAGEAIARLAGRDTYTLHLAGGRRELALRDVWHIRGGRPATVLAEHTCNSDPLPAAELQVPPTAPCHEPPF